MMTLNVVAFEARTRDLRAACTATETVLALLRVFRDAPDGKGPPPLGTPIANLDESDPEGASDPDTHDVARETMEQLVGRFERVIARGVERGEFPEGDARARANLIVASLEGSLMLSKLSMNRAHLDDVLDHLEQYVRNGFSWSGSDRR